MFTTYFAIMNPKLVQLISFLLNNALVISYLQGFVIPFSRSGMELRFNFYESFKALLMMFISLFEITIFF